MKDQIGAELGYVELQVFLGKDRPVVIAAVTYLLHQLVVYLALFAQHKGHEDEKGIHDDISV